MKKIFVLFLSMFLLTGCSAEYNLIFENDSLNESLNVVSGKDNIYDGQTFSSLVDNYYSQVNLLVDYKIELGDMSEEEALTKYDFYNKSILDKNGIYGLNLSYIYEDKIKYTNSSLVYSLFNGVSITESYIKAYSINDVFSNYPNLDNIKISFKTDKTVLSTNCDEEKDDVYYWYLDKDNYVNKTIKINFENNVDIDNELVKKSNSYWNMIYICIALLGIGILIAIIVIYEKVKKSNK